MRTVRLLLSAALLCPLAWAAEVCPPGKSFDSGGVPGTLEWRSYQAQPRSHKFCTSNEIRNQATRSLEIAWLDAGIERAVLKGQLQIAECCFDGVAATKSELRYGTKTAEVTMQRAAEEGLLNHEEGFPDLIEEDARVRTVSIRGTLSIGDSDLRVDILLKCSASQFAKEYAYQYSITDRSQDPVEVEWDLIGMMRKYTNPSVQGIPGGKTYLFLSAKTPKETQGRIELRTKSGGVAAVFRLDGFVMDPR